MPDKQPPDQNQVSRKRPVPGKPDGSDNAADSMYRDRPANDGQYGDAEQEPNPGFPHKTV